MPNLSKNNFKNPLKGIPPIHLVFSVFIILIFISILLFNSTSISKDNRRNSQYSVSGIVDQKRKQVKETWSGTKNHYYVTVKNQNYDVSEYAYDHAKVADWIRLDVTLDGVQGVWFKETDSRQFLRIFRMYR